MLGNLILEMTNAPGTAADCLLTGPTSGRLPFSFAFGSGASCFYVLADGTQSEWGIGTYTAGSPNKLTRTTVLKNSAGSTARLNFLGSTRVYNELPAERVLWIDNSGNVNVATANILAAGFNASKSGGAGLIMNDPAAASDAKNWDFLGGGGTLYGRAVNDLYNAANNWLTVTRTGYAIATITLAATTINLTGAVNVSGALSSGAHAVTGGIAATGDVSAQGAGYASFFRAQQASGYPQYVWLNTAGGTDTKSSTLFQDPSGNIAFQFNNDANSAAAQFFQVSRSGYTVASMQLTAPTLTLSCGAINLGGKLNVQPGDTGVGALTAGSYVTINGSTSFAAAANFIVSGGGRGSYSFEYYWGNTRIGGFDTIGNLLNGAGYYVGYNTIGQNFAIFGDGSGRAIQFQNDGWKLIWNPADGSLVYYNNAGVPLIWSDASGNFNARGSVNPNNTSDVRTKRAIAPYTRGLADLIRLRPVSFEWNGLGGTNDDGKRRYGLVAQDVEPIAPECVFPTPLGPVDPFSGPANDVRLPGQLSLDDGPLRFAFINALRELSEKNTALAARVAALEARPSP